MLEEISPKKFSEWCAYSQIEPFGQAWVQAGMQCVMIGNSQGGKKDGSKWKLSDFMPTVIRTADQVPDNDDDEEQEVTVDQDLADAEASRWRAWASSRNKQLKKQQSANK